MHPLSATHPLSVVYTQANLSSFLEPVPQDQNAWLEVFGCMTNDFGALFKNNRDIFPLDRPLLSHLYQFGSRRVVLNVSDTSVNIQFKKLYNSIVKGLSGGDEQVWARMKADCVYECKAGETNSMPFQIKKYKKTIRNLWAEPDSGGSDGFQ